MVTKRPIQGKSPEPAKFGLLNSKTLVGQGDYPAQWESGITVDSVACNSSTRIVSVCNATQSVSSTEPTGSGISITPFAVQADYTCSTFGFGAQDYFKKANEALELCQNKAIEHELWTGELSKMDEREQTSVTGEQERINQNKYLASPKAQDVTPSPGTAVKPAFGLALLENALAECGCGAEGTVHLTRGVASTLVDHLNIVDDHLESQLGTLLIAGTGYTGSGPTGQVPSGTQAWMYATGQVSVFVGNSENITNSLSEATNTSNNEVTATAEKFAGVSWDGCCHFAVLVDLSLDYS